MSNQTQTGSVFGTVVDNQGSFLPGVTVTLSGIGAPQVLPSDSEGQFRFFNLAPGKYELRAELEGFSPMEYPNVNVSVGGNTEVEMTLNSAIE